MKSHGGIIMTISYFSPSVLIVKKWERYLGKKIQKNILLNFWTLHCRKAINEKKSRFQFHIKETLEVES